MVTPPARHSRSVLAALGLVHALTFVAAGVLLFVLAIHPATSRAGLQFLAWLLVFGSAALIAEHRVLDAAARARQEADVAFLFSREGRRVLAADPDSVFEAEDARRFVRARRDVRIVASLGLACLAVLIAAQIIEAVRGLWSTP